MTNLEDNKLKVVVKESSSTVSKSTSSEDEPPSLPWVNSLATNVVVDEEKVTDRHKRRFLSLLSCCRSNHTNQVHHQQREDLTSLKKQTSIFSWNILAQHLFDGSKPWFKHVAEADPVHTWNNRWPAICEEIHLSEGDIICLQEVEYDAFEKDILPTMKDLGYDGIIQKSKSRGKNVRGYGVATFWKQDRFQLLDVSHHSRTMMTALEDHYNPNNYTVEDDDTRYNEIIAILNCHLEANPMKAVTRVRQLQKPLQELKKKFKHHHLLICGDLNSQLGQSASSTFLNHGSCPKHIPMTEWGFKLEQHQIDELDSDIDKHGYDLHSAYPMELGLNESSEYVTYVSGPEDTTVGIDQIWYHDSRLSTSERFRENIIVGLKDPFRSDEHHYQVIKHGLPSRFHPSDHLSIGCILEWNFNDNPKNLCNSPLTERISEDGCEIKDESELIQLEINELMNSCQFQSDEQRSEFEFVISPVDIVKGQKPSQEQIDAIKKRREKKKKLFNEVTDQMKRTLEKIIILSKKIAAGKVSSKASS